MYICPSLCDYLKDKNYFYYIYDPSLPHMSSAWGIYVCVYIYIYIYIYTHIHMYAYIHTHTYIYMHVYACLQAVMSNSFVIPRIVACQGSFVHGISQTRILQWAPISFSVGSSWLKERNCVSWVSCTAGRFFTDEPPGKHINKQWYWKTTGLKIC